MGASKRAKTETPVVTSVVSDDPTAADKLAEVMLEQGVPVEAAIDVAPPEIPIVGVIGEIFPFGVIAMRQDGSRLHPGDEIRVGERVSVTSVGRESPPMGFTIVARIL